MNLIKPDSRRLIQTPESQDIFAIDVHFGLSATPKILSSKYFYDAEGSRLFEQIMALPEYYLSQTEFDILSSERKHIAAQLKNEAFNLVEFGAGNGQKTQILLAEFLSENLNFHYIPIDISPTALETLSDTTRKAFPNLNMQSITAEYFTGLERLTSLSHRRNVVLFLGSTIGNFTPTESLDFLRSLWQTLNDKDFLFIGFDLRKDFKQLQAAYDDSAGITRAFNFNLLHRINRELGGNFDISKFRHYAFFNPTSDAMESYLISTEEQKIFIESIGRSYHFSAWEAIQTERSEKYTPEKISHLAAKTGYSIHTNFSDSKNYFVDSLWQVEK
jgi:L-histidine Nalpha-methyltransferase